MSSFEKLLEKMVPGASRQEIITPDEPRFPSELGLVEPELLLVRQFRPPVETYTIEVSSINGLIAARAIFV